MAQLERMDDCGTTQEAVDPWPKCRFSLGLQTLDTTPRFFISPSSLGSDFHMGTPTVLSDLSQWIIKVLTNLHFYDGLVFDSKVNPPKNPITSNSLKCECTFSIISTLYIKSYL